MILQEFTTQISSGIFIDEKSEPTTTAKELQILGKKLQSYQEDALTIHKYQKLFEKEEFQFLSLETAIEKFEEIYGFWKLFKRFDKDTLNWNTENFLDSNVGAHCLFSRILFSTVVLGRLNEFRSAKLSSKILLILQKIKRFVERHILWKFDSSI